MLSLEAVFSELLLALVRPWNFSSHDLACNVIETQRENLEKCQICRVWCVHGFNFDLNLGRIKELCVTKVSQNPIT